MSVSNEVKKYVKMSGVIGITAYKFFQYIFHCSIRSFQPDITKLVMRLGQSIQCIFWCCLPIGKVEAFLLVIELEQLKCFHEHRIDLVPFGSVYLLCWEEYTFIWNRHCLDWQVIHSNSIKCWELKLIHLFNKLVRAPFNEKRLTSQNHSMLDSRDHLDKVYL